MTIRLKTTAQGNAENGFAAPAQQIGPLLQAQALQIGVGGAVEMVAEQPIHRGRRQTGHRPHQAHRPFPLGLAQNLAQNFLQMALAPAA